MSTISIVGAGNVARGIATRALAAGYEVELLVRNEEQGRALAGELGGNVSVAGIGAEVAGDIVAIAVPWSAVAGIVSAFGGFAGKTVVDATNPLNTDFTGLDTDADTSGAEEIAKLAPQAKVVKAFNTVFAGNVVAGEKNGEALDLLVAADDAEAKAAVVAFAEKAGFRVIDTGALSQARTMEALAWLHMQLQFTRGTNFASAITIVD
ncbi:MAG TPA: NAD(P)-binding domain-containing protein [Terrimesophilobacter sp.]|nr:NAD(P)-binding domain-containing protein [Terrimesophilobacter sp.]